MIAAALEHLFGPVAAPECRRMLQRPWVLWARAASGFLFATVTLAVLWWWWVNVSEGLSADFSPYASLRSGLTAQAALTLVAALALGPAVTAGSLSGDRERGSMGLLLSTRLTSYEILLARVVGRLAQVGVIPLAGLPAVILLAGLAGLSVPILLTLVLFSFPMAIAAAGLTAGVASLTNRGRDALLGSYAVGLLLLIAPAFNELASDFGLATVPWLDRLEPFTSLGLLIWEGRLGPAWATMGLWSLIGLGGYGLATARLRRNALRSLDGPQPNRRAARRRWRRVPPIGARPMLWKELYIERGGNLGRFGRWVSALAAAYLLITSLTLTGFILHALWVGRDFGAADRLTASLGSAITDSAVVFSILIQWAVGLRAGVMIASERERGTWDALLTSPLDGSEIVRGKVLGSLHSLIGLFLAAAIAWALAAALGAMDWRSYIGVMTRTLIFSSFMAAVGVRASLTTKSATSAMASTVGTWIVAYVALGALAGVLILIGWLLWNAVAVIVAGLTLTPPSAGPGPLAPPPPISGELAFAISRLGLYALATTLIVSETRLRFDRLAGRMTAGAVARSLDEILYGRPEEPVLVEEPRG